MSRAVRLPILVEAATTAVAKAMHVAPRTRPARRRRRLLDLHVLSGRSSAAADEAAACTDAEETTLLSSQTSAQEVSEAATICCSLVEYSVGEVEEDMVIWRVLMK